MKSQGELLKKLNGYRGTPRGRLLLLQKKILTKEEFILYEASLDFADWDKENHPNKYGSFALNWGEIGFILGWEESVVSRHGKKLLEKRFWEKREDGRIQVNGFELIEPRFLKKITAKDSATDLQKYFANIQVPLAKQQEPVAEMQTDSSKGEEVNYAQNLANLQGDDSKSDIVSFKNKFIIPEEMEKELEEYREQKWGKDALCFCKSGEKFVNCCRSPMEESIRETIHCNSSCEEL